MDQITLREYQNDLVSGLRDAFSKGNNHLIAQLDTGGGKTICFSYMSQKIVGNNKKALILTDREELCNQAGGTLSKFDLNPTYIKAGKKFIDYRYSVFVAMSQTLRRRINDPEWQEWIKSFIDIVIIDEAHGQEFNYLFESGLVKDKKVIGFTATPERRGKMRQLGLDYDVIVRGPGIKYLIKEGYLVNCDILEVESADVSKVKIDSKTGDYQSRDMFNSFNKPTLYAGLLKQYKKHTPNQKTIVFCCNIEHTIKTTIELNKAGYSAKFLCSSLSKPKEPKENASQGVIEVYKDKMRTYNLYQENYELFSGSRKKVIEEYRENKFKILVNGDILTKGFDMPDIECVVLYRATQSLTLYLQMIGRGSRPSPNTGKTHFTVLDFGGNRGRLGGYDVMRIWELWHSESKGGEGTPPMKECGIDSKGKPITSGGDVKKGCKRLIPVSWNVCKFDDCGFKYPTKKEAKEVELTLSNYVDETTGAVVKVKSLKQMNYKELVNYRTQKGYKQAWLWRQLWMRGGESELQKFSTYEKWSIGTYQRALNFCKSRIG